MKPRYIYIAFLLVLAASAPVYNSIINKSAANGEKLDCTKSGCHEEYKKFKYTHAPVEDDCGSCHIQEKTGHPTKSGKEFSLTKEVPDLCGDCHDLPTKGKSVHDPVKAGECTKCHSPHGSNQPAMIKAKGGKVICNTCHDMTGRNQFRHKPFDNDECTKCHDPHNSERTHLLKNEENNICLKCHDRNIKTDDGIVESIKDKTLRKYNHPPVTNGCSNCHDPHSSKNNYLLTGNFLPGNYVPGKTESFEVCFKCHDENLLLKEKTTATGFRNGDTNLHYVHVNTENGRNCSVCHDIHGANGNHLVKEKVKFGNWMMPLNYSSEKQGGSCSPGCHLKATYSYTEASTIINKSSLPRIKRDGDVNSKPQTPSMKGQKEQGSNREMNKKGYNERSTRHEDSIMSKFPGVNGTVIVEPGIDSRLLIGMNVYIVNKDKSISRLTEITEDMAFSEPNLPPDEYKVWIDQRDLDDIDLKLKVPETYFSINHNQTSSSPSEVKLEVVINKQPSVAGITIHAGFPKIRIIPNETYNLPFTDFEKSLDANEMKIYLHYFARYMQSHFKSRIFIAVRYVDPENSPKKVSDAHKVSSRIYDYFITKGIVGDRIIAVGNWSFDHSGNAGNGVDKVDHNNIEFRVLLNK